MKSLLKYLLLVCVMKNQALAAFPSGFTHWKDKLERLSTDFVVKEDTFVNDTKLLPETNIFVHAVSVWLSNLNKIGPEGLKKRYDLMGDLFASNKPDLAAEDFAVSLRDSETINVRFYGDPTQSKTLVLFIHGGGWVRGSLKSHDTYCRHLCLKTKSPVVSVGYRLAPDHPFPQPLNDVEDAYNWARQNYPCHKIILVGDSAGANLAAALTHRLIVNKQPQPHKLVLIYPVMDLRIPAETNNPYANGPFLIRSVMNGFIADYLQGADSCNPECSPTLSPHLAQFPETFVLSAEHDLLREEATEFVRKMKQQGAKVHQKVYPGVCHTFAQFFDLFPSAHQAMDDVGRFVGGSS